jgi:hypothetical protein
MCHSYTNTRNFHINYIVKLVFCNRLHCTVIFRHHHQVALHHDPVTEQQWPNHEVVQLQRPVTVVRADCKGQTEHLLSGLEWHIHVTSTHCSSSSSSRSQVQTGLVTSRHNAPLITTDNEQLITTRQELITTLELPTSITMSSNR